MPSAREDVAVGLGAPSGEPAAGVPLAPPAVAAAAAPAVPVVVVSLDAAPMPASLKRSAAIASARRRLGDITNRCVAEGPGAEGPGGKPSSATAEAMTQLPSCSSKPPSQNLAIFADNAGDGDALSATASGTIAQRTRARHRTTSGTAPTSAPPSSQRALRV